MYKNILVIGSEYQSYGIDKSTRGRAISVIFGDGAAAVVLEATKPHNKNELIYYNMKTWPSGSALTEVRGGGTNKHPQDPDTNSADNLFWIQI